MLKAYNKSTRRPKGMRSTVEAEVEGALLAQGFCPEYETDKLSYVLHRKYVPDFKVGDAYVEVKGWWPPADRQKFLAVVLGNPRLKIVVALQKPNMKLSKTSKTTYAKWCEQHGINWCPIPIPDGTMEWLKPQQATFLVPAPSVVAATERRLTQTEAFGALFAKHDTTQTEASGLSQ
jgi:hypothetical protein